MVGTERKALMETKRQMEQYINIKKHRNGYFFVETFFILKIFS